MTLQGLRDGVFLVAGAVLLVHEVLFASAPSTVGMALASGLLSLPVISAADRSSSARPRRHVAYVTSTRPRVREKTLTDYLLPEDWAWLREQQRRALGPTASTTETEPI